MWSTLSDHLQVVYGAVAAVAIVVLLTPAVGGMARRIGAVDQPDGRRLNVIPIPRLGGLALFMGIFVLPTANTRPSSAAAVPGPQTAPGVSKSPGGRMMRRPSGPITSGT